MLDSAVRIDDLRFPPGNRLEKLGGDREGQWGVRINRQWRLCFVFENGEATDVEITEEQGEDNGGDNQTRHQPKNAAATFVK